MTNQINDVQESANTILEDSVAEYMQNALGEETQLKVEKKNNDLDSEDHELEIQETEEKQESETQEESLDEEIKEGETNELEKELSGFNREFIEAVDFIEDPEIKAKLIEAGKKQRASIDRKHQELGEGKKLIDRINDKFENSELLYSKHEYPDIVDRYIEFDKAFTKDPLNAIELLAKAVNLDLSTLTNKTVLDNESHNQEVDYDDDDYKTPEEIKIEKRLKALEAKAEERLQSIEQESVYDSRRMIADFMNEKDENGNLKYPYFSEVREDMALLITRPGMDLDKAYNKAVRMNDELFQKTEISILKKSEEKRKSEVEKAKRLKRISTRANNVNTLTTDPNSLLRNAVDSFYSS